MTKKVLKNQTNKYTTKKCNKYNKYIYAGCTFAIYLFVVSSIICLYLL